MGSMVLVAAMTLSALAPASPIRVLEMQVPDTKVMASQPAALAFSRALGQASRVAPLKKASAPLAARLVTWEPTSPAPAG